MEIKIIRSPKRVKSISARQEGDIFVVRAPAHIGDADLLPVIERLKLQWQKREAKRTLDDDALERRAEQLNRQYFDTKIVWESIRWATDQNSCWGSCTPARGTIRLSHRLATVPAFVRDYVLVHELAHLLEANHGPQFWKLVNRYPKTERARGYLMALGMEAVLEE